MTASGERRDETDRAVESVEADESRPSRSQKHRDAIAVGELGLELIGLGSADLDLLELPGDLRQAIDVCQGLKLRARSRQKRLIAQLLRDDDHEAIRERLSALRMLRVTGSPRSREAQRWLDRLRAEGDEGLQALLGEHPDADRSRLRALMRTASAPDDSAKSKRARRELLRAIRGLLA